MKEVIVEEIPLYQKSIALRNRWCSITAMIYKSGHIFRILLLVLFCFSLAFYYIPVFSSNDDIGTECKSRCSGFTDQAYYQCIETCVRTAKKTRSGEGKTISQRMKECEEICNVYEGLERVKCLRICLDKNKDK
jgi:hypothetical protein